MTGTGEALKKEIPELKVLRGRTCGVSVFLSAASRARTEFRVSEPGSCRRFSIVKSWIASLR